MPEAVQRALNEHNIVSVTDAKGLIVYVNQLFCDISGYSEEELLGQNHRLINSGHHDQSFFSTMWRTISSGATWRGEVKNRHKNGSTYWVSATITPVVNREGYITHYLSLRNDITQIKQQSEDLHLLGQQLKLVISSSGALIVRHSFETDRYELLLGRAPLMDRLSALPVNEFRRAIHTPEEVALLERARQAPGTTVIVAVRNPRTHEPIDWYQVGYASPSQAFQLLHLVPVTELVRLQDTLKAALEFTHVTLYEENLTDGSGHLIFSPNRQTSYIPLAQWLTKVLEPYRGAVSEALSDVGKLVEYQIRMNDDAEPEWLEQATIASLGSDRVLGISRNITREKQVQQTLAKQNELLSNIADRNRRMFAIISHEIKTPLLGATMMLGSDQYKDDESYREQIKDALDHTLELVEQLREMIQPEAMQQKKSRRSVDLVQAVKGVIASQEATFRNNIDFRLQLGWLPEPILELNVQGLRQVTLNLIRNAAIHAQPEHIWVTIYARELLGQSGSYEVTLVVSDDGPGIPRHKQGSIFEAFSQGAKSSVGTGIGLYVCRDTAHTMGGDLVYKDRAGGGAEFHFRFTANLPAPAHQSQPILDTPSLVGKRILFAEDTATIRMLTEQMLKRAGADVMSVEDGRAALNASLNDKFDVVITDYYMPKMSGPELVRELRKNGVGQPIILLTAAQSEYETDAMIEAGATAILTKPLDIDALKNCLIES